MSVLGKGPWISLLQAAAVDVINTMEYNAGEFTVNERLMWTVGQVTEFYIIRLGWPGVESQSGDILLCQVDIRSV